MRQRHIGTYVAVLAAIVTISGQGAEAGSNMLRLAGYLTTEGIIRLLLGSWSRAFERAEIRVRAQPKRVHRTKWQKAVSRPVQSPFAHWSGLGKHPRAQRSPSKPPTNIRMITKPWRVFEVGPKSVKLTIQRSPSAAARSALRSDVKAPSERKSSLSATAIVLTRSLTGLAKLSVDQWSVATTRWPSRTLVWK